MSLKRALLFTAAATLALDLAAGQQAGAGAQAAERASKVRELTGQLRVTSAEEVKRYTPEYRDRLTKQVGQLLKDQVLEALGTAGDDVAAVKSSLKPLGSDGGFGPEFTEAPYAFRTSVAGTPVVITGFLLFRGPAGMPETKVFLQAYKKVGSVWEYVAETGDDMDHRGLFLREVKSPRVGEAWFLAYGNMTGYNGHLIRIRIYAFDGEKFTTVWSQPDRQDAQVKLEGDQLVVQYLDQKQYRELGKPPYTRTDRYVLDFSGAVELSSVLGPN